MELVIKIDDEDYKRIQDTPDAFNSLTSRTYSAIRNSTPLPKGHGRLISEEDMLSVIIFSKLFDNAKVGEVKEVLLNLPTIIEADTESENAK